ncbi:hypothetical protein [Phormidium sp. CCY1219]|uniref:hypothetical protein n=1 Tax=Phormidium sp. CCY1219 TaxID=2886104 RepID=UPI002D1E8AF9|nr:hypothetical protein [Phormidium sp. CCY1219]MEB3831893.1 hypothetical protein [Phormidium sp. CCY1219]
MSSTQQNRFTPAELMDRYEIKKDAYYSRLKYLQIKSKKDPETKEAYLEQPEVDLLDRLHDWINETGSMSGFKEEGGELAVVGNSEISQQQTNGKNSEEEIFAAVKGDRSSQKILRRFDRSAQTSAAAALVEAKNILTGDYIANPDQLDEDLKNQVFFEENPQLLDRQWAAQNLAAAIREQKKRS